MHQSNETLRKSLHIAFGLFAFSVKYLPWWLAAGVAAAAILGNWLILPRVVGKSVSRHERGYDAGTILYPISVLLLILVFRNQLHVAAIAWAFLAFGDGIATLAGKVVRIAPLPWNRDKSWGGFLAFVLAATVAGSAVGWWMEYPRFAAIAAAALIAAIAESLPLRVDDNVTVPFASAVALVILGIQPLVPYGPPPHSIPWLIMNGVLALVGYFTRSVNVSGTVGGWALGTILILGAGWPLYVALLAFFIVGTATTKLGYSRKAKKGLAQEEGGRRGFSHAFSNVGVAAICAIAVARVSGTEDRVMELTLVALFMGVASLATAAADTTASEIGQLLGRNAFLPLTLRRVSVGTEGAISIEGTLAGFVAGFVVALVSVLAADRQWFGAVFSWPLVLTIALCAFVGSYLESIAGNWNRKRGSVVPNGVLNFLNTAIGAILFYYASSALTLFDWNAIAP